MMQPARSRSRAFLSACLVLVFAASALWGQAPQGTPPAAADEQAIRQLISRLYDARIHRDVAAYAALWSPKAPRRVMATFPADLVFPYSRMEIGAVAVSQLQQQATSITARVALDVTVTMKAGDKPRSQRWNRNMGFVKEGDAWTIWRESTAEEDFALDVMGAKTPEERTALLAANPDLVTEDLAFAIETQADRQFVTGNYASATPFYELEAQIGDKVHSATAVARAHLKLGQIAQIRGFGDPKARLVAIEHLEKALQGFESLNDRSHMASTEVSIASSYYMHDDRAARQHYGRAVELLQALDEKFPQANALHGYGNSCYMLGDFGAALDAYRGAIDILQKAGTTAGVPPLHQAIGRVQKDQGDYEAAIASYQKSLENPASLEPQTQWAGLKGLGDVYRLQGRFELALAQYSIVLTAAMDPNPRRGDPQWAMTIEGDIGNVYMAEQQPGAALAHYQKSMEIAQKLRNQDGVARALAGSGSAHFAEMRNDAAIEAFSKALAIREAANDKANIAWLHAHIGLVQAASNQHDQALASFQKALDLSGELRDRAAVAVMQTLLATEQAELDRADEALETAERAAVLAQALDGSDTFAQAKVVAARVLKGKGEREQARRALDEAVAAVEAKRAHVGDEPRDDFFGDMRAPYRALAVLQAEANQPGDALVSAERSQVLLLDTLLTGSRSLIVAGVSKEEQEEERRLSREEKSLHVQVQKEQDRAPVESASGSPSPDTGRLEKLKAALAQAEQQRNAFAERMYQAHPSLKLQRGLFDPAPIDQLKALASDGKTAVLEFVTTEKQTVVLAIARTSTPAVTRTADSQADGSGVEIVATTIDAGSLELGRRIRDFRALIRQRDANVATASRELYDLLLEPVRDVLANKTRLVVVPDGPLWSLPFQALQAADGRFLIQRAAVSYAPSLTSLVLLSGTSLSPNASVRTRRVVAVANEQPGSALDRLTLLNPSADLKPMANAQPEARQVAVAYGPKRSKVYAASAAGRDAIVGEMRDASVLHLATFFVPSGASPLRTPIVLGTQPATNGNPETAKAEVIEAWELMNAAVPPAAIVSRVQAERIGSEAAVQVGLSWVFFAGGAKTTVLATWPDDSPAAVSLMVALHRGLLSGTSAATVSKALRQAILPMLATKYRHPFYWANYSAIGM